MVIKALSGVAIAVAAFAFSATDSSAATCNTTGILGGDDFALSHSTSCSTYAGNDSQNFEHGTGFFATGTWEFAFKNELDGAVYEGDGAVVFDPVPSNDTKSGAWGILTSAYSKIIVVLKAGNKDAKKGGSDGGYAVFHIDVSKLPITDGLWASGKDLSHASIYYDPDSDDPGGPVVPLPAAGWLMIAGLGGLAAAGRKRRV